MMFRNQTILSLIIFFIFFCFNSYAKNVEKITVEGNDRVSDQTIIMFSNVKIQDEMNSNNLNNILKNIYESNFFEDVKVNFENNILRIIVVEKPIIEDVRYEGLKSNKIQETILDLRVLKPKSSFDESLLKKDRDNIYDILLDLGYYFAKVETNLQKLENNKLN